MPSISKMKLFGVRHYPQKTWSPGCLYFQKLFQKIKLASEETSSALGGIFSVQCIHISDVLY